MHSAKVFFDLASSQLTPKIEEEFFSSLMMRNKTYKTTYSGRFSDINNYLIKLMNSGSLNAKRILDIGISSGVSALDLYNDMKSQGYDTTIFGTDLFIDAYIVPIMPDCYAIIDDTGFPLRFDIFGTGVKPWVTSHDYKTGFFLVRKFINLIFSRLAKHNFSNTAHGGVKKIELVTPRLFTSGHIFAIKDDITVYNGEFATQFDFIRAANVLNKAYFSEPMLITILRNIKRYLSGDGSSLLVLRTHEDHVNHGTLFRFNGNDSYEIVQRFGEGSEIENLVMQSHL